MYSAAKFKKMFHDLLDQPRREIEALRAQCAAQQSKCASQEERIDKLEALRAKFAAQETRLDKLEAMQPKCGLPAANILLSLPPTRLSKLEQFELEEREERLKKKELMKKELLKKQKEDELLQLKYKKQQEEDTLLRRILKMFTSKNTAGFPCGYLCEDNQGHNQVVNSSFSLQGGGCGTYVLTLELLKYIKTENKPVLKQKYDALFDTYVWIKKYVMNDNLTPLIAFALELNIDDLIATDLTTHQFRCSTHVELLTRIKQKKIKSKEFYAVNTDEFCKDFEIHNFNVNICLSQLNEWTIFNYWVYSKYLKCQEIIGHLLSLTDKTCPNHIVYRDAITQGRLTTVDGNILGLYWNYVYSQIGRMCVQDTRHTRYDIMNDIKPIHFEPLLALSKIIIDMIDFLQKE